MTGLHDAEHGRRALLRHGHWIDFVQEAENRWTPALRAAPEQPLCRPAPLDVALRRIMAWTKTELDARAGAVST